MASAIQGDFNHAREQALAHLLLAMKKCHEQASSSFGFPQKSVTPVVSGPVAAGVKMPKRRIIEGERKYRVVGSFGLS